MDTGTTSLRACAARSPNQPADNFLRPCLPGRWASRRDDRDNETENVQALDLLFRGKPADFAGRHLVAVDVTHAGGPSS